VLHELQRIFRAAVLDNGEDLTVHITSPRGSRGSRIAVYRNTVQTSLVETLATAFPVVQQIVGADFFARVAMRFIRARPPRAAHLSAYGDAFPAFLAGDATHGLPYLADVARLEWARGESYFAADAPLLTAEDLQTCGSEVTSARVVVHPATRLMASAFPIMTIWRVNQPDAGDVPAVNMTMAEIALTTRPGTHLHTRLISAGDAVLVERLAAGVCFGEAAAAAFEREPAFTLQGALADHLRAGTFTAVTA
jgi:hypothetical protein